MTPQQTHDAPYREHANRLVTDVTEDPWGRVSPSVYETARVVSWAPWLTGDQRRVAYLLADQNPDGTWGWGPGPYRLLGSLSATEALLGRLRQTAETDGDATSTDRLAAAVTTGLAALRRLCAEPGPWPDTAAAEILIPHHVSAINAHLADSDVSARWPALAEASTLPCPRGLHPTAPEGVARRTAAAGLPFKLRHTLEGVAPHLTADALPATLEGLLGSSPAATVAWASTVGSAAARDAASAELAPVLARYDDLCVEAAPFRTVERLWVIAALAGGPGLPADCLPALAGWARDIYDPAGVRGMPGLMVDADDTAMAVVACAVTGEPHRVDVLDQFAGEDHYDCYLREDTGSVSANAHALTALATTPDPVPEAWVRTVADWLVNQQSADGSWHDKWHASPFYGTARCVKALTLHHDPNPRVEKAVDAAARWVREQQRDDGSFGVWEGTAEETAYAVRVLLAAEATAPDQSAATRDDVPLRRAETFLNAAEDGGRPHPAMWQDKTLYAPHAIIDAEILAARAMLRTRADQSATTPERPA